MSRLSRKYPGKTDAEIFGKVDEAMARVAERHSLHYQADGAALTGKVSKMGATGAYAVRDGEVTVDLKYPLLVPGALRQRIEADIERRLDRLFA